MVSDKELDKCVKTRIEEKLDLKRGYYLDKIRSAELEAGRQLEYQDKYVTIGVKVNLTEPEHFQKAPSR